MTSDRAPLEILERRPAESRNPPLVFVHGANVGAWCWEKYFLPYFARCGYHSLAVSLRGHGRSPAGGRIPASISDYVSDVRRVATMLSESPVLIGHSMGARVVEKYIELYPALGAVLLAPIPPEGLLTSAFWMGWRTPSMLFEISAFNSGIRGGVSLTAVRRAFFRPDTRDAEILRNMGRVQPESITALHELSLPQIGIGRRRDLPLLVLGGGGDAFFDPHAVRSTARRHRVAATIVDHVPHAMMLDRDWEAVASRIHHWLGANCRRSQSWA